MTIVESVSELNQLIENGFVEKKYQDSDHVYLYTLNGNKIFCDGYPVYANTIDKKINLISHDARRAYYIEEVLRLVDIKINDIEKNYDLITSSDTYMVFCNVKDNNYTFIEFSNSVYSEYGKYIKLVKLDLNNNNLIYDRIDLLESKYYHANNKISKYTLNEIKNSWSNFITQNNLYDVAAEDSHIYEGSCAYNGMAKYGDFVTTLDVRKLNKKICEVENCENSKIYYL